ncbi:hypothetical protein HGRIS_006635 [Hohenbuehelia grisea]|uniref:RanBP2-type domain-containing protein n=1 Tax=Hohenbuehelia grisea TaxID=104357 RepID=A0ABR3J9K3_9AGAR
MASSGPQSSSSKDLEHIRRSLHDALPTTSTMFASSSPFRNISPPRALDPPFAYDKQQQHYVIDTFTPRPVPTLESSPSSSTSSDCDPVVSRLLASSNVITSKSPLEVFIATRSRVVKLYDLPAPADTFLSAVFAPQNAIQHALAPIPSPTNLWVLREEYGPRASSVWAVFRTHEEARAALALSGPAMSVAPALEIHLEPFNKLRRFDLKSPTPKSAPHSPSLRPGAHQPMLHASSSLSDLQSSARASFLPGGAEYTLSTNPPNPRSNFRLGDWICPSSNCAAHNFGRNLACIGCGTPRTSASPSCANTTFYQTPSPLTRPMPSPRFVSAASSNSNFGNTNTNTSPPNSASASSRTAPASPLSPLYASSPHASTFAQHQQLHPPSAGQQPSPHIQTRTPPTPGFNTLPKSPAAAAQPLLTPSGRAFAVGGKVQNVSSDPMMPCIMYWPDNEPFPEQGQIRPSGITGSPHPPILNTGNRGPITHQPGDWICKKCNYLNWRRRKVCQTCLPYAEGNGDSISAAVQAERIALLTSVLAQHSGPGSASLPSPPANALSHTNTNGPSLNVNVNIPSHPNAPNPNRFVSVTPPPRQPGAESFYAPNPNSNTAPTASNNAYSSGGGVITGPSLSRLRSSVHRSQSHFELGTQYASAGAGGMGMGMGSGVGGGMGMGMGRGDMGLGPRRAHTQDDRPAPILYETGGQRQHQHQHHQQTPRESPVALYQTALVPRSQGSASGPCSPLVHAPAPAPLLPSFLQSMVRSPTLSPASTSSEDLSFEEEHEDREGERDREGAVEGEDTASSSTASVGSARSRENGGSSGGSTPATRAASGPNSNAANLAHLSNIWRMDGNESKTLTAYKDQQAQLLAGLGGLSLGMGLGGSRKSSLEQLQF